MGIAWLCLAQWCYRPRTLRLQSWEVQKYGNKLLEITGICGEINKNGDDKPYIILTSGDEFEVTELQCYFDDESEVKELKKGKIITITGKIKDVNPKFNIPVEDCTIVK